MRPRVIALQGLLGLVAASACANLSGLTGGGSDASVDRAESDAPGRRDSAMGIDAHLDQDSGSKQDSGLPDGHRNEEGSEAESGPPVNCPIITGGNACDDIPQFQGTQTVDGIGSEFCGIYATVLTLSRGALPTPPDAAKSVDASALLRVAWSTTGLHLHVHVNHEPVTATSAPNYIFNADAVELFLSTVRGLTGPYGAGYDQAEQVVVAPPGPVGGPRSVVNTPASGAIVVLDSSQFASRLVDGGYEVELELSWSDIAEGRDAGVAAVGDIIGFDMSIDVTRDEDAGRFTSFVAYVPFPDAGEPPDAAKSFCHSRPAQPSCDDRTWCHPTLIAP